MELAELFRNASAEDIAKLTFLIFGMPFCFMAVISVVLKFFVGLKAKPDRRAMLIVLPAYIIVVLAFVFGMSESGFFQIAMPVAGAPMALLIYWWWQSEFRKAWIDDANHLPEGVKLENDNWKVGLAALAALIAVAAIRVIFIRGV